MMEGNDTYRQMIEEIEDYAILRLDAKGIVMNWNKGAEKIKGYTSGEIIGKNFNLFYTEEDRANKLPERLIEQAANEGKAIDVGWRVKKDGTHFWGSILITAIHDESNKVIGFSKVTRDLTDKINAIESEEKFQKIFQASGVGIIITRDSDATITELNDAFAQMTGYPQQEFIGRTSVEVGIIIDPDARQKVISEVRKTGFAKHIETIIKHKSGSKLDVLISSEAMLLNGEKHAINYIYDITERKKAEKMEKDLVQTKEGFMKLFNASPSGMLVVDMEAGRMIEVNESFLKTFGYTRQEVIGLTANEIGFVSDETQVKSFGKLKEQGFLKNEEVPCCTKTGKEIDALFSVEMFEWENRQSFLASFHDITDIKEMEHKVIESESKYRKIIEEAGDVLYTSDGQGKFTYINQRVTALTEYSVQELIGKHFSILIAPQWQEIVRTSYQNQFKYKIRETLIEFLIHTKTGKEKWVEQVVIMQKEKDFVTGFQCVVRDVTERKKANLLLMEQKRIIEQKNKDILDSINYAKHIQEAIFPPEELVKELIPQSFILFKPKDIISGDFYWIEKFEDKTYIAAVDCTGHGVPGALLSIVGYNLLSKSINEHGHIKPSDILYELSNGINRTLRQTIESSGIKDTMDIALCSIDRETNVLEFAGAYNSLYLIRKGELIEIPADRFPIGVFLNGELQKFTNHQMQLEKGDTIYLFSDGYPDQFGGPKGKKLKYKEFKEILHSIQHQPMHEQKNTLNKTIEEWKWMSEEQTDDILIIGVRV